MGELVGRPRPAPRLRRAASGEPRRRGWPAGLVLILAILAAGCSVVVTRTTRPAIEQELVVRSLERAIAAMDTRPLVGRRVALDLTGWTDDQKFARALLAARLRAQGVEVVEDTKTASVQLQAFASILGVDQGETLLGIPALQVPVVSIPIPEVALFKWVRNRAHTELQMFAFDGSTGRFLERIPDGVGRAKYDLFTVLLVFGFTVTDLPKPAPESADQTRE